MCSACTTGDREARAGLYIRALTTLGWRDITWNLWGVEEGDPWWGASGTAANGQRYDYSSPTGPDAALYGLYCSAIEREIGKLEPAHAQG